MLINDIECCTSQILTCFCGQWLQPQFGFPRELCYSSLSHTVPPKGLSGFGWGPGSLNHHRFHSVCCVFAHSHVCKAQGQSQGLLHRVKGSFTAAASALPTGLTGAPLPGHVAGKNAPLHVLQGERFLIPDGRRKEFPDALQ